MKFAKKIFKWLLYFLLLPILYVVLSLILTAITIDRKNQSQAADQTIYLSTNGIHLDIVLPQKDIDSLLLHGIDQGQSTRYLSFGWGDENFYINTPTWKDLTFKNAFKAMFLKSSTLMHVTRYRSRHSDWIEVKISESELNNLNYYLQNTFATDENGAKILLKNQGYSSIDDFYDAKGSYSCFKTCNSWVNSGFKQSGLKSCLWTPFDFGLMKKYE
ncbi:MAG: TIGR02117 family protein [Bacteroidota bacterium]